MHDGPTGYAPRKRPDIDQLIRRFLDRSSIEHGGTYPGQGGYVGQHRAMSNYGPAHPDQRPFGWHSETFWSCQPDQDSKVTVDDLLRRHCGWPGAWPREPIRGNVIARTYLIQLARQADHA